MYLQLLHDGSYILLPFKGELLPQVVKFYLGVQHLLLSDTWVLEPLRTVEKHTISLSWVGFGKGKNRISWHSCKFSNLYPHDTRTTHRWEHSLSRKNKTSLNRQFCAYDRELQVFHIRLHLYHCEFMRWCEKEKKRFPLEGVCWEQRTGHSLCVCLYVCFQHLTFIQFIVVVKLFVKGRAV